MRSSPFARGSGAAPPAIDPRIAWLCEQAFAHRGLHGGAAVENSRSAFEAALTQGFGIELDVRLSRDGFAVVFHDAALDRLTWATGPAAARDAAELGRLKLGDSADRIETLAETLSLLGGRTPLLIELKTDDDRRVAAHLCLSVRYALEGYGGPAAVMSFDPAVGAWFAAHAPHIPRGLVVGRDRRRGFRAMWRRHLSLRRARPHFLACDVRTLPSRMARRARRRGMPVLAWTVRTAVEQTLAGLHADQLIFESA